MRQCPLWLDLTIPARLGDLSRTLSPIDWAALLHPYWHNSHSLPVNGHSRTDQDLLSRRKKRILQWRYAAYLSRSRTACSANHRPLVVWLKKWHQLDQTNCWGSGSSQVIRSRLQWTHQCLEFRRSVEWNLYALVEPHRRNHRNFLCRHRGLF